MDEFHTPTLLTTPIGSASINELLKTHLVALGNVSHAIYLMRITPTVKKSATTETNRLYLKAKK